MSDEKHVEAAWAKAVEKAAEDAEYVFRDSCSHAAQAIDYMKQVMFTDAPQASQPIGQPVGGAMTDEEIKECIDTIDFSQMVTADDVFYLVARAIEKHILAQASQPVSGAMMDERKLFEDEMRRYGYMEFDLRKGIAGAYIGGNAQIAWHFWKARSLLSASGQAVSEKAELETKLAFLEGHIKRVRNVLRCPDDVNTVEHAVDIMKSTPAQQTEEPVNVSRADLQKLRDSIHGLCYLGEEAEKELIDSLLAAAPAPVVAKLPQPVQTEAQQSEKDAQDAKRYRYITEVAGMRFKPAGRLCLDTLEDTNAAIDDAIAKEKAK